MPILTWLSLAQRWLSKPHWKDNWCQAILQWVFQTGWSPYHWYNCNIWLSLHIQDLYSHCPQCFAYPIHEAQSYTTFSDTRSSCSGEWCAKDSLWQQLGWKQLHHCGWTQHWSVCLHSPITWWHLLLSSLSRYLSDEEIEWPDDLIAIYLIPNSSRWDPQNEAYSEADNSFLNPLTWELIYPKQWRLSHLMTKTLRPLIFSMKQPYQMLLLTGTVFFTAIFCEPNPQGGVYNFNRQGEFMQTDLQDLLVMIFLCALNKRME